MQYAKVNIVIDFPHIYTKASQSPLALALKILINQNRRIKIFL